MSIKMRPELSEKNPYWLPRHRFYELKHFCLQYPIWKKAYASLDGLSKRPEDLALFPQKSKRYPGNPTERCSLAKAYYSKRMEMIEKVAEEADPTLAFYLLKGATEGASYDELRMRFHIPCCKAIYYNAFRRFFWLLSEARE